MNDQERSPARFFLLLLALSLPFWALGVATEAQLMPRLPVSALMAFCPALAASVLVYRAAGRRGVAALLARGFDWRRITRKRWYLPIVLTMPAVAVVMYAVLRLTGVPLAPPRVSLLTIVALTVAFLASALGEELGWSGYAIDPLQARWGALPAALLVGVVWATWHIVPLVQADRPAVWIAWWFLGTVATRVLTVWLYDNTGKSVVATVLFHCTQNLCWQLFPTRGSYYDPRIAAPILAGLAIVVAIVWSPRTLASPLGARR